MDTRTIFLADLGAGAVVNFGIGIADASSARCGAAGKSKAVLMSIKLLGQSVFLLYLYSCQSISTLDKEHYEFRLERIS